MAKQIAILEYTMIFDPSETWSSGYQFENMFSDFFASHGFEAQIVEARGGTGKRVIYINKIENIQTVAKDVPQPKDQKPAQEQIKKVQTQSPTKSFKQYFSRGVPKSIVNQEKRPPKTTFQVGRTNRMKVRVP